MKIIFEILAAYAYRRAVRRAEKKQVAREAEKASQSAANKAANQKAAFISWCLTPADELHSVLVLYRSSASYNANMAREKMASDSELGEYYLSQAKEAYVDYINLQRIAAM